MSLSAIAVRRRHRARVLVASVAVGALVLAGVILALLLPLHLMQRSGRGVAAPMGSPESRWSMVAFFGVQVVAAGAGAVAASAAPLAATAAAERENADAAKKRRARYQPNSPEVQTFYRVNRYPAK